MPRYNDIRHCFRISIRLDSRGHKTIRTADFVAELERHNWHWTLQRANSWIEHQTSSFQDVTPDFSENRIFRLFNPNGDL